ncbi:MAG: rod shape-determining protein MreD [Ardenticatenaceae bacterium]|nr:rod shape-determining protein MreD [Anaerolineales bacterium]MCB8923220.1 rod shape-determining protein MreD [Ardenticatenaceae bacterium]MCB9004835.1 rod shape-determining protein MreD [Ardenticatenaceae bacterium]
MRTSVYAAIPLMTVLAVLETAVLPRFPILGLVPQLPFLVALSWGLLRDFEEGITWAFVGGLILDLFSIGPTGLTALAWMIAIALALLIAQSFPTSRVILPALDAGFATLVYLALYFLLLRLFGYQTSLEITTALPPLAILHALLILPIYWFMYTVDKKFWPRRVQI